MWRFGRPAAALALLTGLLSSVDVAAQTQGLELSLDRDMVSLGGQGQFGQLTCQASGNAVTVESVAVIWVNVTGESTEVLTVTTSSPAGRVSRDGILGNGTLENNNAYLFIDQMDAALCDQSHFLCEVTFTKPSGERERAIATAWPRQPQSVRPGMERSNHTQDLPSLKKRVEDMSAAFEMLNMSFTSLMASGQQDQMAQAKIISRLDKLENDTSSPSRSKSCDPCANVSQALDGLEKRLLDLEKMKNMSSDAPQDPVCVQPNFTTCEAGMNKTTCDPFVILTNRALGREIHCDAVTDGGGWIVFQRRASGGVDFSRDWAAFRDGFGNLTTDFWLGNEALYNLTNEMNYELRVDVRTRDGVWLYNTYRSFRIESEADLYRLRVSSVSGGTLGEFFSRGLAYHNNMAFSTPDRDNDNSGDHCAANDANGSFWHNQCSYVVPNAPQVIWHNGIDRLFLDFIEMKIRHVYP